MQKLLVASTAVAWAVATYLMFGGIEAEAWGEYVSRIAVVTSCAALLRADGAKLRGTIRSLAEMFLGSLEKEKV